MKLAGSCHCGAARFSLTSRHPVPYQRCYCSICRKTGGGGGYAINISGDADSLEVTGREHVAKTHAHMRSDGEPEHLSSAERTFCARCGAALWLFSPEWPALIHPLASVIDTKLPAPPAVTHIMLAFKPDWVRLATRPGMSFSMAIQTKASPSGTSGTGWISHFRPNPSPGRYRTAAAVLDGGRVSLYTSVDGLAQID